MKKRLAIVGAGPIGLEAALAAFERDYEVQVYERGAVGQNIREWGHVQMFTPFVMNVSARGLLGLRNPPEPTSLLTGAEYVERYLLPIAGRLGPLLHPHTEVVAITRVATLKYERVRDTKRSDQPFRLLLRKVDGRELMAIADIVFDCSGVWRTPNYLGDGGMPAVGERECARFLHYGIPDVLGGDRDLYDGKKTLVVGGGHSAATVVRDLAKISARVTWMTRRANCVRYVPNDSLKGRQTLITAAHQLVKSGRVEHLSEQGVLALKYHKNRVSVTFTTEHGKEVFDFDRVIVCTGFRPDLELTRELQVQTCWATEGVYSLSATLIDAVSGNGRHHEGVFDVETLLHPEPNFFTLGAKSYGRAPNFLIGIGREQIESVLEWIEKERDAVYAQRKALMRA